jgi:hypothetical protein
MNQTTRRPPALSFTSLGVSTFGVGGASRSLDLMLANNSANHNWQLPRMVSSPRENEAAKHDQAYGVYGMSQLNSLIKLNTGVAG